MVTESPRNRAFLSQRAIYDERYEVGRYDHRSAVRVLTAEREALQGALDRAVSASPRARRISLFDFGYGTGRVTNELIQGYAQRVPEPLDLRIVAYDVSSVGLQKAQQTLCQDGFAPDGCFTWDPHSISGYIAGSICKAEAGRVITVIFVHACEGAPPEAMYRLALQANGGDPYLITTSWYSGLGHVPGEECRREYFHWLGELTDPRGQIVLAVSATGDLHELQPEWNDRLVNGTVGEFPVEVPGDVVYRTELGQPNFYHVFGTELNDYMAAIAAEGQRWWVEGIRYPGEEFRSAQAERDNYECVVQANEQKRNRLWDAADYREFHTVAAMRSPEGC